MKLHSIDASKNFVTSKENTFKGYVNGKFYKDGIISKAEKALEDPEVLKSFKQKTFIDTYTSWHKEGALADGKGSRIAIAILTLGLSEISWTLFARVEDLIDNASKRKELDEILSCMKDLKTKNN